MLDVIEPSFPWSEWILWWCLWMGEDEDDGVTESLWYIMRGDGMRMGWGRCGCESFWIRDLCVSMIGSIAGLSYHRLIHFPEAALEFRISIGFDSCSRTLSPTGSWSMNRAVIQKSKSVAVLSNSVSDLLSHWSVGSNFGLNLFRGGGGGSLSVLWVCGRMVDGLLLDVDSVRGKVIQSIVWHQVIVVIIISESINQKEKEEKLIKFLEFPSTTGKEKFHIHELNQMRHHLIRSSLFSSLIRRLNHYHHQHLNQTDLLVCKKPS